jgi:DNA polymerase-3 subunit beta
MRITASRLELSRATRLLSKIIVKHARLHPYGWFKLSTAGGLIVEAVSDEVHVKLWVSATAHEEGEVCVEADAFTKAVRSSKSLNWTISLEDDKLVVCADYTKRFFDVKPVEEFPKFPKRISQYSLPVNVLREGLEKVGFAVSRTDYRFSELRYLFIDGRGSYINFVGSDGRRLAVFRAEVPFDEKIYVHHKVVDVLSEWLRLQNAYGTVEIGLDKQAGYVYMTEIKTFEAVMRMEPWFNYPDYEQVLNYGCNTLVEVYARDLSVVLEKYAKSPFVVFELTQSEEGFRVKAKNDAGEEIVEWVRGRVVGEDLTIAFKPQELLDFVSRIDRYIHIELSGAEEPAVISVIPKRDYQYAVMPVLMNYD